MEEKACNELIHEAVKIPRINQLLKSLGTNKPNWQGIAIDCRRCSTDGVEGNARAMLSENPLGVTICVNRVHDIGEISSSLTHELTHAYDFLQNRYDFNTCHGLASSEIRAAREAECNSYTKSELFPYFRNECIKQHAERSTANLYPSKEAKECVKTVFNKAMADLEPNPIRD